MTYSEPESRTQSEIEVDLNAASSESVSRALIDAATGLDSGWTQARALERIGDDRVGVRRAAIVALAHLARRGELRRDDTFRAAMKAANQDPELIGTVEDLFDDIRVYMDRRP